MSVMYIQTNVGLLCCVGSGSNVAAVPLDSLTKIRTYVSGRLYIEAFLQKLVGLCTC